MSNPTLKKINQRLERLEDAVFGRIPKVRQNGGAARKQKESAFSGATGGVRFLISSGLLKEKRDLTEIRAALSKLGYHHSRQAVHAALNNLAVSRGPLVSLEESGRKIYVERK